jgi:hypothetical protein
MSLARELHLVYTSAVEEVRTRLGAADIGHFSFHIDADGRTLTDRSEVKIEYHLAAGYDCRVKGNDLNAVIVEVLRRHGWDEAHAPLALPGTCGAEEKATRAKPAFKTY